LVAAWFEVAGQPQTSADHNADKRNPRLRSKPEARDTMLFQTSLPNQKGKKKQGPDVAEDRGSEKPSWARGLFEDEIKKALQKKSNDAARVKGRQSSGFGTWGRSRGQARGKE